MASLVVLGCGGGGPPPPNDAGPPPPDPASVQNIAAYEGQAAFVTVLESPGDDWTSASVAASSPGLEVLSQACNASLCGVVARVPDLARNTGQTIPAPIDAMRHFLVVTAPAGQSQGLIQVFPTDSLSPTGETNASGAYFAASVSATPGSILHAMGTEPVRWVVFGDATLDTLDLAASGATAGPGGWAGGGVAAAGAGLSGGAPAGSSAGAGGGGAYEEGGLGDMGSEAAPATDVECVRDFFARECGGGGGGGGATGEGGGGGGAFTLMVLGNVCVSHVLGAGGDAASGGGGGGGGGALAMITGSTSGCMPTGAMDGGAGDGTGGNGGAGHLFVGGVELPQITFDASQLITREASYEVSGLAAPDHRIRVERVTEAGASMLIEASSGADGSFSIPVTLEPGLNRLRITQLDADGSHAIRAFNGNHVELERRDGFVRQLPVGGLLDVAYVP